MKKILVLGCTGSIGTSAVDIARQYPHEFKVVGLTAHSSQKKLQILAEEFNAPACLTGTESYESLERLISHCGADIAINGIAGSPGLLPSVLALQAGMDLALANKETIVMAGSIVADLAKKNGCQILPVDSEHSALFTLIQKLGDDAVQQVILTASGGPFRECPRSKLDSVTPTDALKHPTWDMGPKITIDSASLANKGLEVIEACRLFNMPPQNVKVVIHPQSLVHSLVKTQDGVLYAQISPPDMRHPILTALTWPRFLPNSLEEFDILSGGALTFLPPRTDDFPMLALAYRSLKQASGSIAYNAANEVAVSAFLERRIRFTQIACITERVLEWGWTEEPVTIDDVFLFDRQARQLAQSLIKEISDDANFKDTLQETTQ